MEYPEEIYTTLSGAESISDCYHTCEACHAKGKAEQADPLAGYSNLTTAIQAGDPIDWAKLDGKKVQCDNPDVGTNRGELGRNETYTSERSAGWFYKSMDKTYVRSLIDAWRGDDGWTLWVEGDIPLIRKTADQLEVGHLFTGRKLNGKPEEYLLCTSHGGEETIVLWARDFTWTKLQAEFWEVITDHGPIQKPEVK